MKKFICCVFAFVTALLVSSCGNGSSGSTMLDLDVRIVPHPLAKERLEKVKPEERQKFEDFSNLFTVLPGPYEFTWEELKNQDGAAGYEMCSTKLKIKLRLNKTLKPGIANGNFSGRLMTEEEMMKAVIDSYEFGMFNSEGKTFKELSDENDNEHSMLLFTPGLRYLYGVNGKLGSTDNKDGILDFYHFLTNKPGTEFDLVLDCGAQLCKDIENMLEYNKGLCIMPTTWVWRSNFRYE